MQKSKPPPSDPPLTQGVHKLRATLIGFGFLWISFWAILGSLMGYKINEEIVAGQTEWLSSVQRDLLRSTHAHMNTMAILCIATGLSLPFFCRALGLGLALRVCLALPISVVVFGCGMGLEALLPSAQGNFSEAMFVTALGGSAFILICLVLGVAALKSVSLK